MRARFNALSVAALLTLSVCACDVQSAAQTPNDAIFIPKQHRNLRTEANGNSVFFEVEQRYPAEQLLLSIDNHYHPPEWSKKDELYLFPGSKTSDYAAGWRDYLQKGDRVKMWMGNWRRNDGAFVTYIVRYRWPEGRSIEEAPIAEVQAAFSKNPR